MSARYAGVIVDISHDKVDRPFTYRIPEELIDAIDIGDSVIIPFGTSNRHRTGYVIDISDNSGYDPAKIKNIIAVNTGYVGIETNLIKLAAWIKSRYGSTMITALKTVLPAKRERRRAGNDSRFPYSQEEDVGIEVPMSVYQRSIVNRIVSDYEKGIVDKYLIHGITGSGKTRVYIEVANRIVERGKQVIVLIPEISLTYQTIMRFRRVFNDRVSWINSCMTQAEKYDRIAMAMNGNIDVMIGPRSALFTPFKKLGLIIIDEEHESSYKSDAMPKYHAKEVAMELAILHGASIIMGSATPSLESYYKAKCGEYKLLELKERLTGGSLPSVDIVDLRDEFARGNRSMISDMLLSKLEDRLKSGEQSMLFLNRRGYASFVSCRSCGHVIQCSNCAVSLSEHKDKLQCHYCGYSIDKVVRCPECASKYISGFKAGTQQVEDLVKKLLPNAKILRMDKDTTTKKGSYENILRYFGEGKADILIGTQMIVKGHDFPNVTLVGILAADMSLSVNDYRAAERTFSLITQAAGRAGRGELPGEVIIQTYRPQHPSITYAANQDYEGFFNQEIAYRKLFRYPPVADVLAVQIFSSIEDLGMRMGNNILQVIELDERIRNNTTRIGPTPASIGKINNIYRTVIYVKSENVSNLVYVKDTIEGYYLMNDIGEVSVQYDLNPVNSF